MINLKGVNIIDLLNKLKLDKLDSKKMLLIIAVSLAIIYLDFVSLMRMQLAGIRLQAPKIIKLKRDIADLNKGLSTMQDLKKRISDKQLTEMPKLKKVISERELPLLLQSISDTANEKKVRITQINTPKDAGANEEVIAGERLLPITITLNLSCTYHSLGSFINSLENAKQFIEVQDMKVFRDSRDYFIENVTLVLKAYAKK